MQLKSIFNQLLLWRDSHIKERHFLLFVSFLVGITTALAAWLLKSSILFFQVFLTENFSQENLNFSYLLFPIVGILIAGLYVKYVVKDDISHGVTKILFAISQRKSRIKPHNIYTSLAASSVTIGFGGSVGAEAPIVLTGSAIGSNLGRLFRLEQHSLMILVGCGAAGAIAGIFKAPIAGILFVIEVLLLDLTMSSIMPLLVTAVTATTVSYLLNGMDAMFAYTQVEPFLLNRIPYVIVLGILCGFISLYVIRVMSWLENIFHGMAQWKRFLLGGGILSVLIFFFPPLYGEGYNTINTLLASGDGFLSLTKESFFYNQESRWAIVLFLLLVILFKVFATSATNGGGGTGGVFAPTLFLGCIAGFAYSYTLNQLGYVAYLPQENFALMGMAGVMAGVMHAPLTGTFLIAELTGGYELFLPLMIVSLVSYGTILVFEKHSIYAIRLAKRGELITHHKDKAVLTFLKVEDLLETDIPTVKPDYTLGEMVKVISTCTRNIFPVVNDEGRLMGMVLINNIRNIMFRPELYDRFTVEKFMVGAPAKVEITSPMEEVMAKFENSKAWNLPVVDGKGLYMGILSQSSVFNSYREVLVENYSEAND
ncbi:MAG: chloride channel protein [Proteiniphilum sp.]|jgi:CIC family chloride channel protein|nr:chloride channel protein [Proteiniphilum sp.]MDD2725986.1 chloride channel protein [Proteiniphilum sp.]MDD3332104.1 chloride channel protein [Proteiniphilum sp.]MDD3555853.1 chloride channel protein [Proteiniphilum sp.]MDD3978702.1 chloride channel protein [Proteiniphilum sp.]